MARKRSKSLIRRSRKKNVTTYKISKNNRVERASREGKERKIHDEIINRRVSGGITMTKKEIAEAYIRAQEQWLQLPGSIIRTPTDVMLLQKGLLTRDSFRASQTTDDNYRS